MVYLRNHLAWLLVPVLWQVFCQIMLGDFAIQVVLNKLFYIFFPEAVFIVLSLMDISNIRHVITD